MPIETRLLGRTGVRVSNLCLGAMMFGWRTEPAESYEIVDRAIDAGINFIDTANVYGSGRSEEVTGEALARNGKRDRIVLATKFYGSMDDSDPNAQGASRRHIVDACEASLRRLGTDWIDLYQIHRPSPDTAIDETLRALDDLVRQGKVRYLGTSTFAAWQFVESLWASEKHGLNRFVCEQQPYNLLDRRVERELMPMARTYGVATIPWSPLGGGLLTGKYRRGEEPPAGTRFANANAMQRRRYNDRIFDVIEGLEPLARDRGVTLSQYALAWVMAQPGVTSPIVGPRTMEQLEDNLPAAEVGITGEDARATDALIPPGQMVAPFYEADFGPHGFRV
ncbi:MAG: aldo/keto reductase [Gammaproteobacteria bacterium]|nr:aldo/keto reductase [Gammaproteobacteria bacterium]